MTKGLLLGGMLALSASAAFAGAREDCVDKSGDEAIKACTTAIRNDPDDDASYTNRGLEYKDKGEFDLAMTDYNKAIAINPKSVRAYDGRGSLYSAKSNRDRAIADYTKAIELAPKDVSALGNRGDEYRRISDNVRALADLDKALQIKADHPNNHSLRGAVHMDRGDYDKAIEDYGAAAKLEPNNSSHRAKLGYAKFDKGAFRDASIDFLRAIEIKDDAYRMIYRFLAQARTGQAAASELESNAGRLKSKTWPYAVIEMMLGKRPPEATASVANGPSQSCEVQFYIGEFHLLKGNVDAAKAALTAAVAEECKSVVPERRSASAELKRMKP